MEDKKKPKAEVLPESIKIRSGIMAQRLRELRTSKGLSYERLNKELERLYGFTISPDSLQFHEVAAEHHSKAFHNTGMKVQYLYALADYYGVSADYILGYDVPKTPNITLREMEKYTGINTSHLARLHEASLINDPTNPDFFTGYLTSSFLRSIFMHKDILHYFSLLFYSQVFRDTADKPPTMHMNSLADHGQVVLSAADAYEAFFSIMVNKLTNAIREDINAVNKLTNSIEKGSADNGKHPGTPE